MSLPSELRVLCLQLSTHEAEELPRITPILVRHVLRSHAALSDPGNNSTQADASATAVLVHKLKTQLSTLLNGKSAPGRFAAVVLIKAVVEVGGWEILRGAESWVRGLLSILTKPDPLATKELCIIALTKIYCMTHQYQTLVREITTPTLPTFVTSCLNLVSPKSSKTVDVPASLVEIVFRSCLTLLPRHTTIFRPFATQLRAAVRPYLAATSSDERLVSASVAESARSLVVALHQTVAKNGGGEEWAKSVRELVKDIHATADQVFRAVVEDWESTAGYISQTVDVNQPLAGGADTRESLPAWTGVDAGIERLTGLLGLLEEYFRCETTSAIMIPLGSILDMTNRMLSIVLPSHIAGREHGGTRLHPAIDRDERDGLWSGLPQVYVGALELITTIADRMESTFSSAASGCLDQITWIFPSGKDVPGFRKATYTLLSTLLPLMHGGISKSTLDKMSPVLRLCCQDLHPGAVNPNNTSQITTDSSGKMTGKNPNANGSNSNADTLLKNGLSNAIDFSFHDPALLTSAAELLPLLFSHLPQQYLSITLRAIMDRTSILTHNKSAMLASIVNPFIGKRGKSLPTILPHLARQYPNDHAVEVLLRPRMPLVPSKATATLLEELEDTIEEETMMDVTPGNLDGQALSMEFQYHSTAIQGTASNSNEDSAVANWGSPAPTGKAPKAAASPWIASTGSAQAKPTLGVPMPATSTATPSGSAVPFEQHGDVEMDADSDSDDESVHLNMQLDDMSEDDEDE
ncbi:hypothetical protein PVAG01_10548 [Phlyctema vagabunda]|uniref:Pre-rRNA-processing protein RIX1 n=1 Tax=Phlyctema vagabunda TaxID=108571 RepID=A0ABR4P2K3_9HELO